MSQPEAELQVGERDKNGLLAWRRICRGSCYTAVYPGAEYRVSGGGVTNSTTFRTGASPYPMSLHADAGSSSARTLGIVAIPVGGAAFLVGLFIPFYARGVCLFCTEQERRDEENRAWVRAAPVIALGAAVAGGGIWLLVSNRTKLEFGPGSKQSASRLDLGRGFVITPEGLRF